MNPHSWLFLGRLAENFPGSWVLVGGQMVLLHGLESGQLPLRESDDADALIAVKVMPHGTSLISTFLEAEGLTLAGIDREGVGHRFVGRGLSVDVLAPDNIGARADLTTVKPARTVVVPAGARLLTSPRRCPIVVGDEQVAVPRPTLDAAIVGKAAALTLPDSTRHAEDLAFLLGLITDVEEFANALTQSDVRWLEHARPLLGDTRVWKYSHDSDAARAALAYALKS